MPRDSYVPIPGHDDDKISTAFAKGGPRLLMQTVEQLTDIRLDHVAVLDFSGFKRMTDVLGGVRVRVSEDIVDPSNGWSWSAGEHDMDGEEALRFVRERKGLPGGDVDRGRRQQAFIRAMAEKATSEGVLEDPVRLDGFLRSASESMAVDDDVSMGTLRGLAQRLSEVGPERITFASLPVAATDWVGPQNVVRLDENRVEELFDALRGGELGDHLSEQELENDVDEVN
ncbi:LCP family protein [Allosalinactinospora lopnorensis]|uniref:LCP family protein n=1 Tax=Allosalinactinospora lopnorensis TaxID=1352348 RepID=UPI001F37135E|nr:LCP family protein [Allosalinactinospora lopnorensis]